MSRLDICLIYKTLFLDECICPPHPLSRVYLLHSELLVSVRVAGLPHDQVHQGVLLAVRAKAQDRA